MRLPRRCIERGCTKRTLGARCTLHRRAKDRARGTAAERGYDAEWGRLSLSYRSEFPYCQLRGPHCHLVAVDIDHRVPLRAGGRSEWSNCVSTCRPCHRRKTIEDEARWPR